jgi:hypothetical protein
VKVNVQVDDHGRRKQTHQILRLKEVAKVSLAVVYWTSKQLETQYRASGSGVIIQWEDLFDTDRDWWIMVLQMEPFLG